jgi:hypothetical protein
MVQRRREMVVSSMRMDDPKVLEERYMLSARLAATDCAPRALALATSPVDDAGRERTRSDRMSESPEVIFQAFLTDEGH